MHTSQQSFRQAPSEVLSFAYGVKLLTVLSRWGAENLSPEESEQLNLVLEELNRVLISSWTHMSEASLSLSRAHRLVKRWKGDRHPHFHATSSRKNSRFIEVDPESGASAIGRRNDEES